MAGTATVTLLVGLTGGNAGVINEQTSFTNTAANEQVTSQSINGFAAVAVPTVPTQATGVIIIPPTTNANTITLKGVTGDTGVSISPSSPTFIPFGTAPATIGITTGAATTIQFRWI